MVAYDSFMECLTEKLIPDGLLISNRPVSQKLEAMQFFKKDGVFTYLAQLERDYDCNSIC